MVHLVHILVKAHSKIYSPTPFARITFLLSEKVIMSRTANPKLTLKLEFKLFLKFLILS